MSQICLHDAVHRKYDMGMQDDYVCESCGATFANQQQLVKAREEAKAKATK
jgi:hypothetical protein